MIHAIQVGRGAAAVAVVLFHASVTMALPKYYGSAPAFGLFHPGASGVYFFFVLSGFIIAHAHARDAGRPERLGRYAWNRATRIYPMYWLVSAAAIVLSVVFADAATDRLRDPGHLIGLLSLMPLDGARGALAVAWTLFHEAIFYLVFATTILSRFWGGIVLAAWLSACAFRLLAGVVPGPDDVLFSPNNLLFGMGIAAWAAYDQSAVTRPRLVLAAGCLGFAGAWAVECVGHLPQKPWSLVLAYGMSSAAILLGATTMERIRPLRPPAILLLLGAASYSIYLVHFLFVSAATKIAMRVALPPLAAFVFIAVSATAAGVAVHFLVERPLMRLLRSRRKGGALDAPQTG